MDHLQDAIQRAGGPAKVAQELGVSVQAVCFWRDGKRQMPVEHCPVLERLTDGAVMRWDLRPDDWHLIWPELRKRKDAPDVPSKTVEA